jgi:hypothetical protein
MKVGNSFQLPWVILVGVLFLLEVQEGYARSFARVLGLVLMTVLSERRRWWGEIFSFFEKLLVMATC